jgi:hypothetical protein
MKQQGHGFQPVTVVPKPVATLGRTGAGHCGRDDWGGVWVEVVQFEKLDSCNFSIRQPC